MGTHATRAAYLLISIVGLSVASAPALAVEEEDPGLQQLAVEYYSTKYRVSTDEAIRRVVLQDRAAGIEDRLAQVLGDDFAELWYDHSDLGRLKIGMTRAGSARTREVMSIVDEYGLGDDAQLVDVRYSLAELERKQEAVRESLVDMIRSGHAATSYNPKLNNVVVTALANLPSAEEARIRSLVTTEGVTVERWDVPSLIGKALACGVTYCNPPLRGGRSMYLCTGGFTARHRLYPNIKLYVTAGHCIAYGGGIGSIWMAKNESGTNKAIGPAYGYVLGGGPGVDAGVIYIDPDRDYASPAPLPRVIVKGSSLTTYDPNYKIKYDSNSTVGQLVCTTVQSIGTHCAEVSDKGQDFVMEDGLILKNSIEFDWCEGAGGDSGGPFYKNKRGYGILIGNYDHPPWHCFVVYQGIRAAENQLNIDILLSPP